MIYKNEKEEIHVLIDALQQFIIDPEEGLPEDIFLFLTSIIPMINVDLLIRDEKGRVLLSWRDDDIHGKGWHVPGGIFRLHETFEERIQKTALGEIGCNIIHSEKPIDIVEIINKSRKLRSHFITMVYDCRLPNGFMISNKGRNEEQMGFLKWHDCFPQDMVMEHIFYKKYFQ